MRKSDIFPKKRTFTMVELLAVLAITSVFVMCVNGFISSTLHMEDKAEQAVISETKKVEILSTIDKMLFDCDSFSISENESTLTVIKNGQTLVASDKTFGEYRVDLKFRPYTIGDRTGVVVLINNETGYKTRLVN